MMSRVAQVFFVVLWVAGILHAQASAPARHFSFHYAFIVRGIHPGAPLRIWIPLARSGRYQTVHVVSRKSDLPLREKHEGEYGNAILYGETSHADKGEYHFEITYDVVRRESAPSGGGDAIPTALRRRFLAPDHLVPVTGLPAELAAQQTAGVKGGELDRARALYEYVFKNMRYDKSGTGWGHGDALYACSAKKGNCTDFHSLFISMARSQNIPARFEIGFPIPADRHSGEIAGYHCWADFYTQEQGWVPVDISEAWKHQELRDYFFGHHDVNRIQFTVGRDLSLSPRQNAEPLNYFVYPYVEIDGKEHGNVSTRFSFEDASSKAGQHLSAAASTATSSGGQR